MDVTRTLTWVSRALFAAGLLLFAGLFVFMAVGSSATSVDANGQKYHTLSADQMGVITLVFSSIVWCWLAGGAARALATAASWPRALTEIATLVGFGIFFAIPVVVTSGASSESGPTHIFAAAVCAITGIVVIVVAKIVAFAAFGAKDAVHSVEQMVDQVQHSIADARVQASLAPPVPQPGVVEPSAVIFTPEPVGPDRPSPSSQV